MTPLSAVRQGLVPATLEILSPKVPDPRIPLRFNPSEYQLQKSNNFAEIGIPGLESPPIQFVRGAAEKLSLELLADTSDTLEDVREKYVNKLRNLMRLNADTHAPPIVAVSTPSVVRGVPRQVRLLFTSGSSGSRAAQRRVLSQLCGVAGGRNQIASR